MDALERDFYEERRRTWRRSAFWRGFAVAAILAIVVGALSFGDRLAARGDHVARFAIEGVILDDARRDRLLREMAAADHVKALIVQVNSPGGTTVGSEAVFDALRRVAAKKPVVAVMGEVAASGGYVAAIAADHVIARGSTLTGSIGVILEYPDLTEVMARWGVGLETVRSSDLKGEPSPFRPTPPAARAMEDALVADSYAWFRDLVAERRGLSGRALDAVANGRVFTGRLAREADLIDAIGGEPEAVAWLESRDAGLRGLPVRDWEVERETGLLPSVLGAAGSTGGILNEISRLVAPKLYSIAR